MSLVEDKLLKQYVIGMEGRGLIRKLKALGGAPLVFAVKQDSAELRIYIDYRKLNKRIIKNRYSLPLIDSLLDKVADAKWFVKLDLTEVYYLIRIKEGDEYKTAFKTLFGLYEYLVIPFRLCNAPATFQSYIDSVLTKQLNTELIVYLDDILIFAQTKEELEQRTKAYLLKLREVGLYCKLLKCMFHKQEVPFLGFIITNKGMVINDERIQTIKDWPTLKKPRDILRFTGFTNYFRRFIFIYSRIARPIIDLLKKNKILQPFRWITVADKAFQQLKAAFIKEPLLRHFNPELPIYI